MEYPDISASSLLTSDYCCIRVSLILTFFYHPSFFYVIVFFFTVSLFSRRSDRTALPREHTFTSYPNSDRFLSLLFPFFFLFNCFLCCIKSCVALNSLLSHFLVPYFSFFILSIIFSLALILHFVSSAFFHLSAGYITVLWV